MKRTKKAIYLSVSIAIIILLGLSSKTIFAQQDSAAPRNEFSATCDQSCRQDSDCSHPDLFCTLTRSWSGWETTNSSYPEGNGDITSINAFIHPQNGFQQHYVRGGRVWQSTDTGWTDVTSNLERANNFDGNPSGAITSFSSFAANDGTIVQHLTQGGEIWRRDSKNGWGKWQDVTPQYAKVGSGTITSFKMNLRDDKYRQQFLVRGGQVWQRDRAGFEGIWINVTDNLASIGGPGSITSFSVDQTPTANTISQTIIRRSGQGARVVARQGSADGAGACRHKNIPTSNTCQPPDQTDPPPEEEEDQPDTEYKQDFIDFSNIVASFTSIFDFSNILARFNAPDPTPTSIADPTADPSPTDSTAPTEPATPTDPPEEASPTPASPYASCGATCQTNSDCSSEDGSLICSFQFTWEDRTSNVSNNQVQGSNGNLNSFSVRQDDNNVIHQHLVKGGKVWYRNNQDGWSKWEDQTDNFRNVGSGPITSFKAVVIRDNIIQQYLVRDGQVWQRDNEDGFRNNWRRVTTAFSNVGNGKIRSFSTFVHPDGNTVQHLVRARNQMWSRTNTDGTWSRWQDQSHLLDSVGQGSYQSLQAQTINNQVAQYVIRDNQMWYRSGQPRASVCRHRDYPESNVCQSNKPPTPTVTPPAIPQDPTITPPTPPEDPTATPPNFPTSPPPDDSPTATPPPLPRDASCNDTCDTNADCNSSQGNFICSRQDIWNDVTDNFDSIKTTANSGSSRNSTIDSFSSRQDNRGVIHQHVVKNGQVFYRNNDGRWSQWQDQTDNFDDVGSGYITSFKAVVIRDNIIQQYLVRGGKVWQRDNENGFRNNWKNVTAAFNKSELGSGAVTSFSTFVRSDSATVQHLIKGGEFYQRTHTNDWSDWESVNYNLIHTGEGTYRSFQAQVINGQVHQYFSRGQEIWQRHGQPRQKVCRARSYPQSNICNTQRPPNPTVTPATPNSPTPGPNCQRVPIKSVNGVCNDQGGYTLSAEWNPIDGATQYVVAVDDDNQFWTDKNGEGEYGEMVSAHATSRTRWSKTFDTDVTRYVRVRIREASNCTPQSWAYGDQKVVRAPVCEPDPTAVPAPNACNQSCNSNADCPGSYACSFQYLWNNVSNNVSDNNIPNSGGAIYSFSVYQDGNTLTQYLVKGRKVWRRQRTNTWSAWEDVTSAVRGVSSGQITSFHVHKENGVVKQHLVIAGKLYYRERSTAGRWSNWDESSKVDRTLGSGDLKTFDEFVRPDGIKIQHAVKGSELWSRQVPNDGSRIPAWQRQTSVVNGVGSERLNGFTAQNINNKVVQYVVRGRQQLWTRTGTPRGNVCRDATYPESTVCATAPTSTPPAP